MEAHALHKRGWSISAIARHLDRDRKTIPAYINGDRTPGQRRDDRRDPLAPYAAYVAARFVDDPHIWASALYEEVTPLGYPRSYVTLLGDTPDEHGGDMPDEDAPRSGSAKADSRRRRRPHR